jgi:DNA/RNA endonuclease YhcR with UshA esterase domain
MPKVIIRQTAPTPCADATVDLNGNAFLTIPSGGAENIILQDQTSTPIVPSSVVGATVTVNIPRDVFIKGIFSGTNDQMEQLTIDADNAGTYTAITTDGGSGTISFEVNGSPATLPFTLDIGDTLDAERSTFVASGFFKITGTY